MVAADDQTFQGAIGPIARVAERAAVDRQFGGACGVGIADDALGVTARRAAYDMPGRHGVVLGTVDRNARGFKADRLIAGRF